MKTPNPLHIERVCQLVSRSPYPDLLSMVLKDMQAGSAILEVKIERKHLQPFGIVHGGVIASLIDTATFWAIYMNIPDAADGLTSIDLKLNYLSSAPADAKTLIAKGRQIKLGKTLGYAEAEVVTETGQLIGHGTSTLMIMSGKGLIADPPLPPKFI